MRTCCIAWPETSAEDCLATMPASEATGRISFTELKITLAMFSGVNKGEEILNE